MQEETAETQAGPVAMDTEEPAAAAQQDVANGAAEPSSQEAKAGEEGEEKGQEKKQITPWS